MAKTDPHKGTLLEKDRRKNFRRVHRADKNQGPTVAYLRRFGVKVWVTTQAGGGGPDFVASSHGVNILFELKRPGNRRKLTDQQRPFHETWEGPIYVVESGAEALRIVVAEVAAHRPDLAKRAAALKRYLETQSEAAVAVAAQSMIGQGTSEGVGW